MRLQWHKGEPILRPAGPIPIPYPVIDGPLKKIKTPGPSPAWSARRWLARGGVDQRLNSEQPGWNRSRSEAMYVRADADITNGERGMPRLLCREGSIVDVEYHKERRTRFWMPALH
jgi:hypothetical protein